MIHVFKKTVFFVILGLFICGKAPLSVMGVYADGGPREGEPQVFQPGGESCEDDHFLVVGFRARLNVKNPQNPENETQKEQLLKELSAIKDQKDREVSLELKAWQKASGLVSRDDAYTHFQSIDSEFHYEKDVTFYVMVPYLFMGKKEQIQAALGLLDGREALGGKFKVEEVLQNRYELTAEFGFYNEAAFPGNFDKHETYVVIKQKNFLNPFLAEAQLNQDISSLIEAYKNSSYFQVEGLTHILHYEVLGYALLDASWLGDSFLLPNRLCLDPFAHTDEKLMFLIVIHDDTLEIKKP